MLALPTHHTVVLGDPMTNEPLYDGRPQSVARLIRFNFPPSWAGSDAAADIERTSEALVMSLVVGDFIACSPKTSQFQQVHVARVERNYPAQNQLGVTLYWIAPGMRNGPWRARRWSIWCDTNGRPFYEVVTFQTNSSAKSSCTVMP